MSSPPIPPPQPRLLYIDNLRWLMIVLVVAVHASVTYSGVGSWYYTERIEVDRASLLLFVAFEACTQAYFMGLLFLIAGYFVPASFDRKGAKRFLADRAWRLGMPTLIYAFLVHPLINYYLLGFRWTLPKPPFFRAYGHYLAGFRFVSGTGPMWFTLALLIFSAVYAGARLRVVGRPRAAAAAPPLPCHRDVVVLGLLIGAGTFLVRWVEPIGNNVFNLQLGFFTQYIVLFAVGVRAYRADWLQRIPQDFGQRWFAVAMLGGPLGWALLLIGGGALSGGFARYAGGLTWQSAAYSFWESFFCLGVCLGLLVYFRDEFNQQGRLTRFLSANAFTVYVFHAPILIALSLALRDWHGQALAKFGLLAALSLVASFLVSHLALRRIPLLKAVL
ncbi:MAG: acyltransferase family protein [Verrucomicrobia bacterium]|nr:acyltransferase family protein [Verrucomicrobiota bacterium]